MNRVAWKVMLLLWSGGVASGQGTFLYTWHGDHSLFQASFQITPQEHQPGADFRSPLFTSSIRIISPDNSFHYAWPEDIAGGNYGPPLDLGITIDDREVARQAVALADRGWAVLEEFDMANSSLLWSENGYWSELLIPEPSFLSLLVIFGIVRGLFRRRNLPSSG